MSVCCLFCKDWRQQTLTNKHYNKQTSPSAPTRQSGRGQGHGQKG